MCWLVPMMVPRQGEKRDEFVLAIAESRRVVDRSPKKRMAVVSPCPIATYLTYLLQVASYLLTFTFEDFRHTRWLGSCRLNPEEGWSTLILRCEDGRNFRRPRLQLFLPHSTATTDARLRRNSKSHGGTEWISLPTYQSNNL